MTDYEMPRDLRTLALQYHIATERYDLAVCEEFSEKFDCAMPITLKEHQQVAVYAQLRRRWAHRDGERLGYSNVEVDYAISIVGTFENISMYV